MRQVYIFSVEGSKTDILNSHAVIMKQMNRLQKELEGNGVTTRVTPTDEFSLKMEIGKKLMWLARSAWGDEKL